MKRVIFAFLYFFVLTVFAGDYHHSYSEGLVPDTIVIESEAPDCSGAAGVSAAQIDMDWSTSKLQGGIGFAGCTGIDAATFSIGGKYKRALLRGSITADREETIFGAGVNWRF